MTKEEEIKQKYEKMKQRAWREGYEAGLRTAQDNNKDAIKIGDAILEVMYSKFSTLPEDY